MEEETAPPPSPTFLRKFGPALMLAGISVFFIVASVVLLFKTTQTSEPIIFTSDQTTASESSRMIVADIEGAVEKPGLYELPEGARVEELLQKAGGLTSEADSAWVAKTLNRAGLVSDGAKLYIPKKGEIQGASIISERDNPALRSPAQWDEGGISVNTASQKELESLTGVGEVTAQKIIAGRPYQRIEELVEKKVLKPSVYEKIKGQLTL